MVRKIGVVRGAREQILSHIPIFGFHVSKKCKKSLGKVRNEKK